MKTTRKILFSLFFVFCFLYVLSSCGDNAKPTSYYINSDGDLIVVLDDGKENDLGKWGESIITSFKTITIGDDGYYVINGVKTSISAIDVYTVSFNTGYEAKVSSQKIKDGYRVEKPTLDRVGYTFGGWYYNEEEWHFNTDTVKNDMTLTAKWTANDYFVNFVNEKGTNPDSITVTYDNNVTLPEVDEVDGYTFDGWYYDSNKVEDGKWAIADNITLTAKWTPNTYTITLDPGVGSVSETSFDVTYDEDFSLPIPTNDYGVFIGWFDGDTQVTDAEGNSLEEWNYTEDKTLTTSWIIHLNNKNDLEKLYLYPNGYFQLDSDIDLLGEEWVPVGTQDNPFTGIFDGNGHKITNLSITAFDSDITDYSMFGYTTVATFENITMENVNIAFTVSKTVYVGAIASRDNYIIDETDARYTSFNNIKVAGTINITIGGQYVSPVIGGICAYSHILNAENCSNAISISGGYISGGIYGKIDLAGDKGKHLINTADISASSTAGGIIGDASQFQVNLFYSKNSGNINAAYYAGGIIGKAKSGADISQCCNLGKIQTTDTTNNETGAGGLIGMHGSNLIVSNSYNQGNIIGSKSAGGICGGQLITSGVTATISTSMSNVYNSGSITGSFYIGGLNGLSMYSTTFSYSCNFGSITGTATRETFGYINVGTASNCYYSIAASGSTQGTYTSDKYSSSLYKDTLFWNVNTEENSGIWILNSSDYPKLYMIEND